MPRARITDARLFASAECLNLPFLAPRAVIEFPAVKNARARQDGGGLARGGKDQAKDTATKHTEYGGLGDGMPQSNGVVCSRRPADCAGGLLQTSWLESTSNMKNPLAMRARYADIYNLTRQSIRYSSSVAADALELLESIPAGEQTMGTTSSNSQRLQPTPSGKSRPTRLDIKRANMLNRDQRHLDMFLQRHAKLDSTKLFLNGNYRSLRRSIANLERWAVRSLDLTECVGGDARSKDMFAAFTALNRTAYPRLQPYVAAIRIRHHGLHVRWRRMLFAGTGDDVAGVLWKNWNNTPSNIREDYWRWLLIFLLDRKPGRAIIFLEMLTSHLELDDLDRTIIADALGHLVRLHVGQIYGANCDWESEDPDTNAKQFVPAFCRIFRSVLAERENIYSQDLLYNIAVLAKGDDLKKTFDMLVETGTRLNFDTLLHYTSAFAKSGEIEYALKSLDQLPTRIGHKSWEAVADRERLRWSCALLLRNSMRNGQNYHDTPIIVERLVRLGLKMDTLMYSVIMHNAMEAGDHSTAFKVYEALGSNGLEPTKHTLSILLHGCTQQSNPSQFQNFADHCRDKVWELRDPWLATDYLYFQYIRLQSSDNTNVEHTSSVLWQTYLGFFSPKPLDGLIDPPDPSLTPANPSFSLLNPPPMALYIMLHSHIRTLQTLPPARLQSFFQAFHVQLSHAHSSLTTLAKSPLIWNTFLHAFCATQQFSSASALIKHMIDHGPMPNTYTWNIFMQSFFKSGQLKAADRVWQIMQETKVKPDQYTYGVLLRGFAKAQLVDRVGELLGQVEGDGDMHPEVLSALAGVNDRKKLMAVLETARAEQEARETEAADERVESAQQRWEAPAFEMGKTGTGELDQTSEQGMVSGDGVDGSVEPDVQGLSDAEVRMLFSPAQSTIRRLPSATRSRRAPVAARKRPAMRVEPGSRGSRVQRD